MTRVQDLLALVSGLDGCPVDTTLPVRVGDVYPLAACAWHMQLADAAIDEGDVMLAKDHIKFAIAAVREFNQ